MLGGGDETFEDYMNTCRHALVWKDRLSYQYVYEINRRAHQHLRRSNAPPTPWASSEGCHLIHPKRHRSTSTNFSHCKWLSTAATLTSDSCPKLPFVEDHQHLIERTKRADQSERHEITQASERLKIAVRQSRPEKEQQSGDTGLEVLNAEDSTLDHWRIAYSILCEHDNPHPGAQAVYRHQYSHRRSRLERQRRLPRQPRIWDRTSLTVYIHELTAYMPPRPILSQLLPSKAKDDRFRSNLDLANVVLSVLRDENLRDYVTIKACHVALRFFCQHRFMVHARTLYMRMEYLKMEVSTETWNIMLEAYAVCKDLPNFTKFLKGMVRRGFGPDANTWSAFTMVLDSAHTRSLVIRKMRSLGVLENTSIQQRISSFMIGHHVEEHMQEDGGIDITSLFSEIHDLYGPHWLSTSAGNQVLSKLIRSFENSKSAGISKALDVLAQMKAYGFTANHKTLSIFLHGCERVLQRDILMQVLVIFQENWKLRPDLQGHERLFRCAWLHRDVNFLRAIWISACVKGYVTFSMQDRIMQSVLQYSLLSLPDSQAIPFTAMAGWFVLSVNPHGPITGFEQNENFLRGRDRQVSQALVALKSNLALVGQASMPRGLLNVLRQALGIDYRWYQQGFWTSRRDQDNLIKDSLRISVADMGHARPMKAGFLRVGTFPGGARPNKGPISALEDVPVRQDL